MKRWLALVLACVMLLGVFTGCGQKPEESKTETPQQTDKVDEGKTEEKKEDGPVMNTDEKVTLTWTIPTQQSVPLSETPLFKAICEKLNVEIQLTELPPDQYAEKKKLLISAKEIPDVMSWLQYSEAAQYGPVGAFLDLNQYMDLMPNFKKACEDAIALNADNKYNLYMEDGSIYRTPHYMRNPVPIFDFSYVKPAFEEVGVTELNTMDDVYNGLKALKEAHPESYPITFAFGNDMKAPLQLFCMSFTGGVCDSNYVGFDYNTDEFVFGPSLEGYKEAVAFFAKLYTEGLLDPEYTVLDLGKAIENLNDGKSFMTANFVGGLTGISSVMKDVEVDLNPLPLPQGGEQPQIIGKQMLNFDSFAGTCLSKELEKDPVKLGRCLALIDYLYSEEFYQLQWFHPDVTNEDGTYNDKVYVVGEDFQTIKDTYFPWSMMAIFQDACDERPLPGSPYQIYRDEYLLNKDNADKYVKFPTVSFTQEQQTAVNKCLASLDDRFNVRISEFAEGKCSMDEWDNFANELMEAGGSRLIELYNEAYQAMK